MSSPRLLHRIRIMGMLWLVVAITGCATIAETEYQAFTPMKSNARLMNQVKLTWEVRADVGEYCMQAQNNQGNLTQVKPLACAIWTAATQECKVVTSPNPNHLVLGHEVRHCFEGHFHH